MPLGVSAAIARDPDRRRSSATTTSSSPAIIEARLHGERDRVIPRVFARPLTFNTGQTISAAELVTRLNDVGYAERSRVSNPGEFAIDGRTVAFVPRGGEFAGRAVQVSFAEPPVREGRRRRRRRRRSASSKIVIAGKPATEVSLDPPVLTGLVTGSREKRRRVALEAIPAAHAAGGARHRGPPLLLPPRRRPHPHGRRARHQPARQPRLPGGRQHHHPAAGPQLLPHRGDGRGAADAPALDPAQAARTVHGR